MYKPHYYDFITAEVNLENLEKIKEQTDDGSSYYECKMNDEDLEWDYKENEEMFLRYSTLYDYLSFTVEQQEKMWKHYYKDVISEIDSMESDDEKFREMLSWFMDLDYDEQDWMVTYHPEENFKV